jgi:hypothetical protein
MGETSGKSNVRKKKKHQQCTWNYNIIIILVKPSTASMYAIITSTNVMRSEHI